MLTRSISSRAVPPGTISNALPRNPEPVLRKLVAVALDVEEDLRVHQPRLGEGDDAVAVGQVSEMVDGRQFDQRHSPARLTVDDFDRKRLFRPSGEHRRQESSQNREHTYAPFRQAVGLP